MCISVQFLSRCVAIELATSVSKLPTFLGRTFQGSVYTGAMRTAALLIPRGQQSPRLGCQGTYHILPE